MEKELNIEREVDVVSGFLKDVNRDAEQIRLLLEEMKILRKHEMLPQIEKWHEVMKFYKAFSADVAINAERVKRIASNLRKQAGELPSDWKKIVETDDAWNFDW